MRNPLPTLVLIGSGLVTLAACTTNDAETAAAPTSAHYGHSTAAQVDAGGVMRSGAAHAMMAEQYTPRAGPYAATGASAWVSPAPAPAFVATAPMPAAGPEAPVPAAVANRQPSTPAPAAPASEVARPEAAQPAAPAAATARDPAVRTAGVALFNNFSCGACHIFADAGGSGGVGPSLDRKLAVRTIVNVVTDGRGAMPSFGGQMSDAEILTLANYLNQYSR